MDPLSLALMAGGTILGATAGKSKTQTKEPFEGYSQNVKDLMSKAMTGMNTPGKRYGGSFDLNTPDAMSAVEGTVLGRLREPAKPEAYSKDISDNLYKTQKARLAQSYDEERKRDSDRYNRLGLATSTPGMESQRMIGRDQVLAEEYMGANQASMDFDRLLKAKQIADDENNFALTQGQILGRGQIDDQKYTQGADYADFVRAEEQPLEYARLAASILGGKNPTEGPTTMNAAGNIGMAGQDIGSLLMMMSMLGKGAGQTAQQPWDWTQQPMLY